MILKRRSDEIAMKIAMVLKSRSDEIAMKIAMILKSRSDEIAMKIAMIFRVDGKKLEKGGRTETPHARGDPDPK